MKLPRPEAGRDVDVPLRKVLRIRALRAGVLATPICAVLAALGSAAVQAQDAAAASRGRSGLTIQPRLGVMETLTDNATLSSTSKQTSLITQVSPGLHIDSPSGRIRGTLDYSLNGILYTGSDQKSQVQNALNASGIAELIEQSVYVEAQASIAQQALSAFGQQSSSNSLGNNNRQDVANVSVSPSWRGRFGSFATFELRGNAMATNTKNSVTGDSHGSGGSFRVNGLNTGQVQWWASVSSQESYFRASRFTSRSQVGTFGLTYRPDVDFTFTINGGPERNNYTSAEPRTSSSFGASATWTPSPRTRAYLDWQHHEYGDSHSVVFEHRRSRSLWRYSDTQSVTVAAPSSATQPFGTSLYNLFFQQCVAAQVDPATCPSSVSAYLLARGLDPNQIVLVGSPIVTSPTMQRLQDLSFSYDMQRTSLLFSLNQSNTALLNPDAGGSGDFALSSRVRLQGMTFSLSHTLTPLTSMSFAISLQRTLGDTAALTNNLRSFTAGLSTRFGQRLSASFGARHSSFSGPSGYRENALTANLVQQF